jgi:site-specific DNA-adenine methylase
MKTYGIPYMGSKDKIADSLMKVLPKGRRFIDLFGGGFSMSECALRSGKYEYVVYSDFNPLVVDLVKKAINGDYNFKRFVPYWVDRQQFERERESNGYIKYIWSFANNGQTYLYGKDIEEWKKRAYEFVVFGIKDKELLNKFPLLTKKVTSKNIHERRLQFSRYIKSIVFSEKEKRLSSLQSLESLQRIESVQKLEALDNIGSLQRLETLQRSYEDYEYEEGDIVYCDIPYEDTAKYSGGFDHKKFYEWVDKQPFPVYISSYKIKDTKWKIVWAKCKVPLFRQDTKTKKYAVECLYRSK